MEQQQKIPTPSPSVSQPKEPPPQPQAAPQPPKNSGAITTLPSPSTFPTRNPNPNQAPRPLPSPQPQPHPYPSQSQSRPPSTVYPRPWQQHSNFSHFPSTSGLTPSSSSPSPSMMSAPPRGGVVIGVPAVTAPGGAPPSTQTDSFPGSFGQHFGGVGRGGASVPESGARPMQGMGGMMGTLGSGSQMRPSGISVHHQERPMQSSLRPPSSSTSQSPATQNFQGHRLMGASPGSSTPSTSQSMLNQPWLAPGTQGKPPLPPASYRPPMNSPTMQQRAHIVQQHHPVSNAPHQQHMSSVQPQQSLASHQSHEHSGQQFPPMRGAQSLSHQQQIMRVQSLTTQKPSSIATGQSSTLQPGTQSKTASMEIDEYCSRILSKRSIHELVSQIDPTEKLDTELEDILVDIADEFVDSITTFGCSLAKHRKSETLEAKDILLHLEKNWNIMPPGFGGDEIKTFKKPLTTDIHKERLAAIKKSINTAEAPYTKNPVGHSVSNVKGSLTRPSANPMGSPNFKPREVA